MNQKKITAFIGSPRRLETDRVLQTLEAELKSRLELDFERVYLKDFQLENCKGCFGCLTKGEEFCPLQDDRDKLLAKIAASDGVIFATPNYSLQVTAILKNFLDRLAFVFHRPRFFGKKFMAVVTQGVYGGKAIVKYLEEVAGYWGFEVTRGCCVTTPPERTLKEQALVDREIKQTAVRFSRALSEPSFPKPSFAWLAVFRMIRSMYRDDPNESSRDYRYFRDNGWFCSDYYYPVRLNPVKRCFGRLIDTLGGMMAKRRRAKLKRDPNR